MKGDYSRFIFDPKKHYKSTLIQQGRVLSDADWNVQQSMNQYHFETEAKDVIGQCGVPEDIGGFEISILSAEPKNRDIAISPGRIYVDGILCELEEGQITTYLTQPDYPNPNFTAPSNNGNPPTLKLENNKTYLAYLDVWHLERTALDDPLIREVALGGSDTITCLKTVWQIKLLEVDLKAAAFDPNPTLNFLKSLRDKLLLLARQRIQARDRQAAGFIDGIQQPITPFLNEFPNIPAQSRLDSLRRLLETLQTGPSGLESVIQLANQLGLAGLSELPTDLNAVKAELIKLTAPPKTSSCKLTYPEWDSLTAASTGTLNARTQTPQSDDNPCLLPPTAGYQRLENQHYRFEIHQGGLFKSGSADTVTGKWSRDNGSVVTAIEKISGQEITVQTVGLDDILGFANGQWVEIIDDRLELKGQPGELKQIASVNPATRVITLSTAPTPLSVNPDGIDISRHPKLRRWDSSDAFPIRSGWIPLEGGIEVQLSEGTYKTGDYWLIPARSATGEIEWPPYEVPNINPIPQLPLGIKHHYCRLAILEFADPKLKILEDCRQLFPPLTKIKVNSGIHITEVSVLDANDQAIPLKNDTEIPFESLSQELQIVCDRPIDPQVFKSNNQLNQPHPSFFITVNLPFPTNKEDKDFWGTDLIFGYQPINLKAETGINGNIIFWRPTSNVRDWLRNLKDRLQGINPKEFDDKNVRVLVSLTLKGNFIWSADDPKLYLDGEAFSTRDGETRSNLMLPSGDGSRGGDFEMWFWLAPPSPPRLVDFQINPDSVEAGTLAKGTVTLDKPALEGGVNVNLISGESNIAIVPASVTVVVGKFSAEFEIRTVSPGNNQTRPVPITASLAVDQLQKVLSVIGPQLR